MAELWRRDSVVPYKGVLLKTDKRAIISMSCFLDLIRLIYIGNECIRCSTLTLGSFGLQ